MCCRDALPSVSNFFSSSCNVWENIAKIIDCHHYLCGCRLLLWGILDPPLFERISVADSGASWLSRQKDPFLSVCAAFWTFGNKYGTHGLTALRQETLDPLLDLSGILWECVILTCFHVCFSLNNKKERLLYVDDHGSGGGGRGSSILVNASSHACYSMWYF